MLRTAHGPARAFLRSAGFSLTDLPQTTSAPRATSRRGREHGRIEHHATHGPVQPLNGLRYGPHGDQVRRAIYWRARARGRSGADGCTGRTDEKRRAERLAD